MSSDITGEPTGPGNDNTIIPVTPNVTVSPGPGNYLPASAYAAAYSPPAVRQEVISGVGTLLPIVFGVDRVGAKITLVLDYGQTLVMRCEWAPGPCDGTNRIIDRNGDAFPGSVTWTHYYGTQVTPDPTLVAACAAKGITYTDTLNGICYSVGVFPRGSSNGFPRPINELRGLIVPTSSGGTPMHTENALVYAAWVIESVMGESVDWGSLDLANADSCDLIVGGEPKRRIGLTIDKEMSAESLLELLCGYAGVWANYDNGKYVFTADAPASVVATLSDADMLNGSITVKSRNLRRAPNKVRVVYTDRSGSIWKEGEAEASTGAGDIISEVKMNGVFRKSEATRIAIERLNEFRLVPIDVNFTTKDTGLILNRGDVISVTHPIGLTSKQLRCGPPVLVDDGRWAITCFGYSAAKYSSVVVSDPIGTDPGVASPLKPPIVDYITLNEVLVDATTSRIAGTFPLPVYLYLLDFHIKVLDDADAVVYEQFTPTNSFSTPPLRALSRYRVRVSVRSTLAEAAYREAPISLLGNGTLTLASVYSAAIPKTGWNFFGYATTPGGGVSIPPESYSLRPGDAAFRFRFAATKNSDQIWTGSNQTTPGLATELHDAGMYGPCDFNLSSRPSAISPMFDIGKSRTAFFSVLNVGSWLSLFSGKIEFRVGAYQSSDGITGYVPGSGIADVASALSTGRYFQISFLTKWKNGSGQDYQGYLNQPPAFDAYFPFWQIEFDTATIEALMPVSSEELTPTSSASGPVTVTLGNRYITITSVQVTPSSSSFAAVGYSNLTVDEAVLANNTIQVHAYDQSGVRISIPLSVKITGVRATT